MKSVFFRDVMPFGTCKNQRFGRSYRLHHQGDKNRRARNNVSSNSQPKQAAKKYCVILFLRNKQILVTLMMEAMHSSETSILTRVTRRNISDDNILHSLKFTDSVLLDEFLLSTVIFSNSRRKQRMRTPS
jgi:hypothetical protein